MKFLITGSGGCVCTPKPLCQCSVCVEARKRVIPINAADVACIWRTVPCW